MISVVIPLYNKDKSISKTINCVLNQTFQDFEIVVVNDGSTDNSVKKVEEIRDDRIRLIQKKNGGVSSARNKGIEEAKYEWIAFLDGDDRWQKDHLKLLINAKTEFVDNFVFTNCPTNNENELYDSKKQFKHYVVENYFKKAINEKIINSSTCLIHKQCFANVGFFNEKLKRGEDLEMWYRLAKKYHIVASDAKTVIYELDAENRAMNKSSPYEASFASVISLKGVKNKDEKNYLKHQIKLKYKSCLYNKEWLNLIKCFKQHKFNFL